MNTGLQLIEKDICSRICDSLDKVGLLYRIFSRTKEIKSIQEKLDRKTQEGMPYSKDGKKMQDVIGIRVITYFQDDIPLVKGILSKVFIYLSEEIDSHAHTVFKPKRTNVICKLDTNNEMLFNEVKETDSYNILSVVDSTFELQLRTILSEGWHEIDHSLRYKCKDEWEKHGEKERMLNGIYATLEVNDIALKSLFNELAYQHFKIKDWEAMLRNKYRLKFQLSSLKPELKQILDEDNDLAKELFKIERENVLSQLAESDITVPINFNNIIYLINHFVIKNDKIRDLTPEYIRN